MNLATSLTQRQTQTLKLTMTQELTQAITLLQYSTQELTAFLENKALENPLLQVERGNVSTMDPRRDRVKKTNSTSKSDKQAWLEQIAKTEYTLAEHLLTQIDVKSYNCKTKRILSFIINSLNENGYLHMDIREVAEMVGATYQEAEEGLKIVQRLDPVGVGARNLQECLLLQIRRKENINLLAERIVSDFFYEFAEKKWKNIVKDLDVDMKDIQSIFDYVQTLNPRPGSDYSSAPSTYIIPDVIIKWNGNALSVNIFDEAFPNIQFNGGYFQKFNSYKDKQVTQFLHEKQHDYQWIMKSIEQRKETIKKVALKIIEKQQEFFICGPEKLKPMTMKEVSDELGIHESTVSRAVREKYAQTPFGTFELKSFFTSAIKMSSNEETGCQEVKNLITKLVENEDKYKPLSDQDIVNLLKKNNDIMVSRRTIAKYRDQLGIPSSSKRKRF